MASIGHIKTGGSKLPSPCALGAKKDGVGHEFGAKDDASTFAPTSLAHRSLEANVSVDQLPDVEALVDDVLVDRAVGGVDIPM